MTQTRVSQISTDPSQAGLSFAFPPWPLHLSVLAASHIDSTCFRYPQMSHGIILEHAFEFVTSGLACPSSQQNWISKASPSPATSPHASSLASHLGREKYAICSKKNWKASGPPLKSSSNHASRVLTVSPWLRLRKYSFPSTPIVWFFLLMDFDSFIPFFEAGY